MLLLKIIAIMNLYNKYNRDGYTDGFENRISSEYYHEIVMKKTSNNWNVKLFIEIKIKNTLL